jgi:hypothetical protein
MINRLGRQVLAGLVAISLFTVLGGCGTPSYTYVTNTGDKTYFKVPRGWTEVDRASLDKLLSASNPDSATAALEQKLTWTVGFDADQSPSASHMLEASGNEPFVYVTVSHLTATQRDAVSLNSLRDYLLPVSADARAQATSSGFPLTGFELLADQVVTPSKGIHGVHAVYNYQFPDGVLQTYDQTAYVSDDASRVYLMLISCSARCHHDQASQISKVAHSFTVRSP